MEIDFKETVIAHDAQLKNLTERVLDIHSEVKKLSQYVDENEEDYINYTDTFSAKMNILIERTKKTLSVIDLLLESNQRLKDEIYVLKQKVSANEKDISYLETVIEDNI